MTATPDAPDDMTELYDARIDRVDLVGAAANGTRVLLAKQDATGLIPADTVRELVAKAETTAVDAALDTVAKAGRALSSANEKALRAAAEQIQAVLNSLPKAPEPALAKESATMADQNTTAAETADITKDAAETAPEAVVKSADEALAEVVKADGLIAVYDETGCLVGVVKPNAITTVQSPAGDGDGMAKDDIAEEAADGGDAPADGGDGGDAGAGSDGGFAEEAADGGFADAAVSQTEGDGSSQIDGTGYGDDTDDDSRTIPGTSTIQAPALRKEAEPKAAAETDLAAVLKEALAPLAEKIAQAADLASTVEVLKERIEKFGAQPDNRTLPAFNGANGANAGLAPREGSGDPLEPLRKAVQAAQESGDEHAIVKANSALLFESVKNRFNH